ncbi:MAG: hypothetical protein AAGF90_02410 [Pseudomonadota bacterium]
MWTLVWLSVVIHAAPVSSLPWSVFVFSGGPRRSKASFSASTQKSARIVFDSRELSVLRVALAFVL